VVTVIEVPTLLLKVPLVADDPPNVTLVVLMNPVPVIVTTVPPVVAPELGEIELIVGAGATYVYALLSVPLRPFPFVTTTSTTPDVRAGVVAVIVVVLTTLILVAVVPPNVTVASPEKPVPAIVTLVPPLVAPDAGATLVGAGTVTYVYPPTSVTFSAAESVITTSMVPSACAGATAVMRVAVIVTPVAAAPPKLTVVPLTNPVPVKVTVVPPVARPDTGAIESTENVGVPGADGALLLLLQPKLIAMMARTDTDFPRRAPPRIVDSKASCAIVTVARFPLMHR
jgi:hypothetical protein